VAVVLTLCRDASNMVLGVFSLFLLQLTAQKIIPSITSIDIEISRG